MSEMLERILEPHNMAKAYRKVVSNGGAGGVDGVGTEELKDYIIANWKRISEEIRNRTYRPQPVRRVEIPEPNGGERKPGVPTAMDRVIEQAMVQVLSPIFEPAFSDYSYGFRPGGKMSGCDCETARISGRRLHMDSGHRLGEILRQCPTGQADELRGTCNPRWRYGITDSQVPESRSHGGWKV